jgi:predicted MFS family arabinose efflux permease
VIEALWGAAWAFFQPAYTGLLPQTVQESEIRNAQSLMSGSWNLTMLLGPSIGTVLVLTIGAGAAFAVDAGSFLVSAMLLAPMRPRRRAMTTQATESSGSSSTFRELREGFHEVASRPWVWVTILAYTVTLLCYFATWSSLAPLATRQVYGSVAVFGVLAAVSGAGSVIGSVIAAVWHPRRPLRDALAIGVIWPASAIVLALGAPLPLMIAWAFLAGINSAMFIIAWETSLASYIPPQALSRVSSYDWMGSLALLPVGYALAGPLATAFGVRTVLGVGGAIGVVAVSLALLPRSTRRLGVAPLGGSGTANTPVPALPAGSAE